MLWYGEITGEAYFLSVEEQYVVFVIIIYLESECIGKYQVEICSKYDREHDFNVILG